MSNVVKQMQFPQYHPLGDCAVTIRLGDTINPEVHRKVQALTRCLEQKPFRGFVECVPTFVSVTVFYDLMVVIEEMNRLSIAEQIRIPYDFICAELQPFIEQMKVTDESKSRVVDIPVCYGGLFGPDLIDVAQFHGLCEEEVIHLHSQANYLAYMIGFAPGFPYLGGLPEKIATPRRSSPRLSVPIGSVGIGDHQTGVYPLHTPGGWQIIGRTPLQLFRPHHNPPTIIQAGDCVRFVPISAEEYYNLEEQRL